MANVKYLPIDGELVSAQHHAWMMACRADGVTFRVNEGHRTMARQKWFWDHQPPLAAFPSDNAPHIRTGNPDHDNDIDMFFGDGVQTVMAWLRRHGAHPTLCVPGEGWHMCLTPSDLKMLYDKFKTQTLHLGSRGPEVKSLQAKLRAVGRWKGQTGTRYGRKTKDAVMGYQHSQGIKADGIYGPHTRKHLEADARRARDRNRSS